MKALIFAAGLGTRLRPLTDDRPKAMVEIAGKPMLQHVIERVAAAGFDDITINIHHYGQMIIDFLERNAGFSGSKSNTFEWFFNKNYRNSSFL